MYNVNNPSIKRILREVKEMEAEPNSQYHAAPLEDNLFEWHFTIRGPAGTEFEGGLYHGRIILPPEYPFKPPNIVLLNQSGRFEVGTKICLSISSYHPEHWQPSWSIRTVLVALISFMPTKGEGAIGAIDSPPEERKRLAVKSVNFVCDKCGARVSEVLPPEPPKAVEDVPAPTATLTTPNTSQENNTNNTTTTTTAGEQPSSAPSSSINNAPQRDVDLPARLPQPLSPPPPPPPLAPVDLTPAAAVVHAPAMPIQAHVHGAPVEVAVSAQHHASDSQMLDYMIIGIVVAIIALLVRKYMQSYANI